MYAAPAVRPTQHAQATADPHEMRLVAATHAREQATALENEARRLAAAFLPDHAWSEHDRAGVKKQYDEAYADCWKRLIDRKNALEQHYAAVLDASGNQQAVDQNAAGAIDSLARPAISWKRSSFGSEMVVFPDLSVLRRDGEAETAARIRADAPETQEIRGMLNTLQAIANSPDVSRACELARACLAPSGAAPKQHAAEILSSMARDFPESTGASARGLTRAMDAVWESPAARGAHDESLARHVAQPAREAGANYATLQRALSGQAARESRFGWEFWLAISGVTGACLFFIGWAFPNICGNFQSWIRRPSVLAGVALAIATVIVSVVIAYLAQDSDCDSWVVKGNILKEC